MNVAAQSSTDDWGPFGRPLFDDPAVRRLSRIGVVDVGSNSVRLVIFDGAARSPAYFYNEKVMCCLGEGMSETGRLNPEGKVRALDAIRRFQTLANGMGLAPLSAVATAAMREAEDGQEFQDEVMRETGLRLFVIDGPEEARLSAQGVLLGWPKADGLVCDIGGSSMELAVLSEGKVGRRETSALGPLKLRDVKGGRKAMRAYIDAELTTLKDRMGDMPDRLFLVGGSWRAIAKIDMARRNYPLKVLHEYLMRPAELRTTLKWIGDTDLSAIKAMSGVSGTRLSLVPYAAEVLSGVLKTLKPREIAISSYGLREGLLYEQMPQMLRDRDPLIEACRFAEIKDARVPGFGKVLYRFIRPIYSRAGENRLRLVQAACLLHDVSWRSHPDYRGDVCFDYATRANFGGLSHQERLFLGLSMMHRYKSNRSRGRFDALIDLMDPEDVQQAQILGRALRFGAMFTAQKADNMGTLRWHPNKKRLVLSIGPQAMALYGEVAQSRFASLAKALGAETEVVALRRAVTE
ncbi:Ppx/GppA family phosphatase [Meridianimarinicoccus aquatilis]|uniref:Ppx/GppA family phosphatase n=1 Tax=Meridianimarinicoccus aquatilis TaxID=2552766 RepID=A0A4R6AY72_9RHOB|nr:Ppx/GppA family phosphatase [Fluviibacterium aquatile]QIE41906.1 Ppx/GppA family phosphatase [Rhodobacteraceae bacterium SC52]TDL87798.1 Ppx/GppA family phosphatase [Fluviibacterium aquatile]